MRATPTHRNVVKKKFLTIEPPPMAQTPPVQVSPVVSTDSGVGPAVEVPVPLRVIVCGLLAALSTSWMSAEPVAVGWKEIVSAQDAPGAMAEPTHWLLRSRKSSTLVPPGDSALKNTEVVPVLVTVTVWAGLVVATAWAPKVTDAGLMVSVGAAAGGAGAGGAPPPPAPPGPPPP